MAPDINPETPLFLHLDLNSCFATVAQQANPLLRGKPVGVCSYDNDHGTVISPSVEAKRYGIRVGTKVPDARRLAPGIVILTPDPPLVRDVHLKLKYLLQQYTPSVVPKSIDECILDFHGMEGLLDKPLMAIGREIKERIKAEIGDYITCSVGISTNSFLAKVAAGMQKPDGLVYIDHANLIEKLGQLELRDLTGIAYHYEARLNTAGIFTPLEFFHADPIFLQKQVFHSIEGYRWHRKLHGYEAGPPEGPTKSIGQQYVLPKPAHTLRELSPVIMKLVDKMSRRMRRKGFSAHGFAIRLTYMDKTHDELHKRSKQELVTPQDFHRVAMLLIHELPRFQTVRKLEVTCYAFNENAVTQETLFDALDNTLSKKKDVQAAVDTINDRYGELTVYPALILDMDNTILDRVAFGSVKELDALYGIVS